MKWVVAVLLVINAGLFLWATANKNVLVETGPHYRPDINPARMILLSEKVAALKAKAAARNRASKTQTASRQCYRIGPFYNASNMNQAQGVLEGLNVEFNSRTVKARQVRAYRVFLGPFSSRNRIDQERQKLNRLGVRDHYVVRGEGEGGSVSLGLFSQRATAERYVRQLASQGIKAQTQSEDRALGPTFWLETRGAEPQQSATVKASKWLGGRASLREIPCG